jgi:hypothetical protein
MKALVSLLFFLSTSEAFSKGTLDQLIPKAQEMIGLINEAKDCEVTERNGSLIFCTGFELNKEDLDFLKSLNLKSCKNFLKQVGNKVIDARINQRPKEVSVEVWRDFFSTTKLALILHGKKTILFKGEAKRGDCLHETLHFYQRNRKSYSSLSPLKRGEKKRFVQGELEKAIVVVEKLEKLGKKEEAGKIAQNLQPFIKLQREWINIGQWLDEKEIYQAFLDFPHKFGVGERDEDIALANLLRLKNSLSWQLRERVVHLGNLALTKKYNAVEIPTNKTIGLLKTEKEYQKLFHKGLISREEYEEKVIALRKYKARLLIKSSPSVLDKLDGLGRMREFSKAGPVSSEKMTAPFKFKDGFMQVSIGGFWMVVDFGAQKTILPKALFNNLKMHEVKLLASQVLKTTKGQTKASPYIQVLKGLSFGKSRVVGIKGAATELGLKGVDGVLGMDFFRSYNSAKWVVDFEKKILKPLEKEIKGVSLVKNGSGNFDSLEYHCRFKPLVKVRVDSGSQVFGDVSSLSKKKVRKCFSEKGRFGYLNPNSLLFSRKVDVNLGLPFLREKLASLSFDLKKGLLKLSEKK